MKIKAPLCVVVTLTLTLTTAGFAFAEDNDPGKNDTSRLGNREDRQKQRDDNRRNYEKNFPDNSQYYRQPKYQGNDNADDDRGAIGHGRDVTEYHSLRRGQRLPAEYRGRQYVVDDWRGHHLSPPPRGYQWVQTGGDYVLVAVATGLVTQVIPGY